MTSNLKSLIGKLNPTCRSAMEGAAGLCLSRTHYDVDLEHLLLKVLEGNDSDLHRICRQYDIDTAHLDRDLNRALDGFKKGNTRTPALSARIPQLFEQAWLIASIDYNAGKIRSGHLLIALLSDNELRRLIKASSAEFGKISIEELQSNFLDLVQDSSESTPDDGGLLSTGPSTGGEDAPAAGAAGKTPSLDQYTIDLTARAAQGHIDPVLGRDREVRQMIDILMRRRQNNPIMTGEAGVGKTAVVEGFALRIAAGDVPPPLQNVILRTLDLGLLQAGASVKGEFENRLKSVIEEVKQSPRPIILFIDEAHTLIGAGGAAGQGDAANLLKPALARGELRTVAATTWSEYKKYFEKDAALARRFQVVKVEEPTEEQAIGMLRGLAATMEAHHGVRILDEGVSEAVRLSHRYLSGRQLPDKAVSILDTACARVAISRTANPAPIEDAQRRIVALDTEIGVLTREERATGIGRGDYIAELVAEKQTVSDRLAELEAQLASENELVDRILDLRGQLEADEVTDADAAETTGDPEALRQELATATEELAQVQGETPLIQVHVDGQTIGEVISGWTGIPVGKMLKDEIATVLSLNEVLAERVIGQNHALDAIARRIRTARASLDDARKPIGVFLLVGPSGVGKTETALALADILYGGERNMVTINMSEYQEAHTVSGLKGSPPGYVGYGEGGVLTEAVRRKPYSIVLLDEVEKAHPDVLEMFFQVFDKGMLDDSEGREIDFKNTVIILTSNVGTDTIMQQCLKAEHLPDPDALREMLRPELNRVFKPAFLGRLSVVPYYPIRDEIMHRIIQLKLGTIKRRIQDNHGASLVYDESLVQAIAERCTEVDSGARNVDHILTGTVLPEISETVLARMAEGEGISRVEITVDDEGSLCYSVD